MRTDGDGIPKAMLVLTAARATATDYPNTITRSGLGMRCLAPVGVPLS